MARRQPSKSKITADLSSSILTGFRHRALDEALPPAADQEPEPDAAAVEPQPVDPLPAPTIAEAAPEPQALAEPVPAVPPPPPRVEVEPDEDDDDEEEDDGDAPRRPTPQQVRTRDLARRPGRVDGRVDGRTLRRTYRLPLSTRITEKHHDTVRYIADETGLSIAEIIEQGIDLFAKKVGKRKK